MKSLKDFRRDNLSISPLTQLEESGLVDEYQSQIVRKCLTKENTQLSTLEKQTLIDLLEKVIAQQTEILSEADFSKVKTVDKDINQLPSIIVLHRRAIRVFPNGQKVAMYWADGINRYITVPFSDIGVS